MTVCEILNLRTEFEEIANFPSDIFSLRRYMKKRIKNSAAVEIANIIIDYYNQLEKEIECQKDSAAIRNTSMMPV